MPPILRRPVPLACLIGVAAEALFAFRLGYPHKLVFDEVHYVPAARTLMALTGPTNIEHPLLGKLLIGVSMRLFGDDPPGWRVLSTLAATAVVMGIFAIAWLLWRRPRTAALAAAITLLNFTCFIQARIAMLDGFMAAFLVGAVAMLLWAMRAGTPREAWARWLGGAVLFGLALGTKWVALPYIGYAGLGFLWVRWRDARAARRPSWSALGGRGQSHWPGLPAIPALLALGLVSGAVYLATFAPAFWYQANPLTWRDLLPFQATMFHEQTQVLPPHTYQSRWYTWPLMIRPIWYFYEPYDGAQRGIFLVGNPAVLWGGLIAVAACLWAAWRDRAATLLAVAGLWIGSIAMWALIPKSLGFFYYYYPSSLWLALPIAGAFQHFGRGRRAGWDESYLVMTAMLFVYFYPILSAWPLAGPQSFAHWMWFKSWP